MKSVYIISFFLMLCLFTASCIKEVDIPIDSLPKSPVVNGLICPDSSFKIRISMSSDMDEAITFIDDATVNVYVNDNFWTSLTPIGNGWYSGPNPSAGNRYKIETNIQGFDPITATTSIPYFPLILDKYYEKSSNISGEFMQFPARTIIEFEDNHEETNFYVVGENTYRYDQSKEIDESILSESDLEYDPGVYYFSDKLFNGKTKKLILMSGGMIHYSGLGNDIVYFYEDDYSRDFSIVSKEYFDALKTWTYHLYNQSNDYEINDPLRMVFLGEPVEMYSNINGGYGVFAGYNLKKLNIPANE